MSIITESIHFRYRTILFLWSLISVSTISCVSPSGEDQNWDVSISEEVISEDEDNQDALQDIEVSPSKEESQHLDKPILNGDPINPFIDYNSAYHQSWSHTLLGHQWRSSNKYRTNTNRLLYEKTLASRLSEIIKNQHYDFPLEIEEKTIRWIRYFLGDGSKEFVTWLRRAEDVKHVIEPILSSYGLPKDLIYLAMIESGFQARAHSRASALGPWQFISATGKLYGLQTGQIYDERLDLNLATHAACRFLLDLYKEFGNWHLAVAAYNAGQRRIRNAIQKGKNHHFFYLVRQRLLPVETQNYVSKIQAAMILAKNRDSFGFQTLEGQYHPDTAILPVHDVISLEELAEKSQISPSLLKNLNPALRAGITPPSPPKTGFPLRIPKKYAEQIEAALKTLCSKKHYVELMLRPQKNQRLQTLVKNAQLNLKEVLILNPKLKPKSWVKRTQWIKVRIPVHSRHYQLILKHFRH